MLDENKLRGRSGVHIEVMRGESHRSAKYTQEQAQAILDASEEDYRALAKSFGMSITYASRIRRRKSWKHLKKG